MDHLDAIYRKDGVDNPTGDCTSGVHQFWTELDIDIPKPPRPGQANQPKFYMEAILQQLGTIYTADDRMALLPATQNRYKNVVSTNHVDLKPSSIHIHLV